MVSHSRAVLPTSGLASCFGYVCASLAGIVDIKIHRGATLQVSIVSINMHEIVTLQLGQRANYLATHFWNLQVLSTTITYELQSDIYLGIILYL